MSPASGTPSIESTSIEATLRYAFLGPQGTFAEAALQSFLRRQNDHGGVELLPQPDVVSAIDAVRDGRVDIAIVPMENSVEGGVAATLDSLAEGSHLRIVGEEVIPVTFVLAVRPDFKPLVRLVNALDDVTASAPGSSRHESAVWDVDRSIASQIRSVGTHTHAQAQCRNWLAHELPNATDLLTSSTASAAQDLATGNATYEAAICAPIAAERYGLKVVARQIEDNPGGLTRFVAIARNGCIAIPTGADRTTLVVHLPHNQPGALLEMLEQFVARGVNLSRIESRPIGKALGNYSFSLDVEGHIEEQRMQEVLIGLRRICPNVRFLGSYPRADNVQVTVREGTADDDFIAARDWVEGLRAM